MNRTDAIWSVGRLTIGTATELVSRLRVYGEERVPREGGVVVAANHFSWIDPPALGAACPRTLYMMAKVEAHRVPGLGQLMRSFGAFAVRLDTTALTIDEVVERIAELVEERR